MRKALVSIAVLLVASFAFAANYAEFDLDDIQGNGPDVITAQVSDYILVDVWAFTDVPVLVWGIEVHNVDGSLEFQSYEQFFPTGWTCPNPTPPVIVVQGQDMTFSNPMYTPVLVATITYHAAVDCSVDDLTGAAGLCLGNDFVEYPFDAIGGQVIIGGSATEETNWGAVKGLFR
jgi:hypothetical protein